MKRRFSALIAAYAMIGTVTVPSVDKCVTDKTIITDSAGEYLPYYCYDIVYKDDIVGGAFRVMQGASEKQNGEDGLPLPPYAVYNIGGGTPENLLDYISTLQEEIVRTGVLPSNYDFEGHRELVGMQPGDMPITYADNKALEDDYGFRPTINIREDLRRFAEWSAGYYK